MNLYSKLLVIQTEIKVSKSHFNKFGEFNYRSCEDILEVLKPYLKENNLVLILSDEIITFGEKFYVKATAKLIDCVSGELVENSAYARECEKKAKMDESQITGSTSSYARKYALSGLLCLDDSKDSDVTNTSAPPKRKPEPEDVNCEHCNSVIMPFTDSKGKTHTVEAWVKKSISKFGVALCYGCITAAENKEKK